MIFQWAINNKKLPRKQKKHQKKMFSLLYRLTRNHKVVPLPGPENFDVRVLDKFSRMLRDTHRVIRQDVVAEGIEVSTVFLGLNHRHLLNGPPLLFETMIFGGAYDMSQWRYTSYKKALKGHRSALDLAANPEGKDAIHDRGK